ncbi:leucine-rich repeat protein [Paludibacter sp.]|uniref:leucine-rich repeat protein n=1 Tax=Paludibacter sp. TaxID=1898105 RepID=UPI001352F355|nr:leucine-rich repeat protein [Paludibacter sp.]MTK52459.1 leucine-rich repeat protein [Paludibacter sp.]
MRKIVLFFVLILCSLQAWAATTFTVDGVTYTITDPTNKKVAIGDGSNAAISKSTSGAFTIPSSVVYGGDTYEVNRINSSAFYGCYGLVSINIPSSVTSVVANAFFSCTALTSILVDSNNPNYSSNDGVLFNKTQTMLIQYPLYKDGIGYVIPSSVTSIEDGAFMYCSRLTSINIPSSVTSIGDDAFAFCDKITNINIPSSVTFIGRQAFYYNKALASISVDSNNLNYSSNDGVLFNKAQTMLIQYPLKKPGVAYDIPSSVASIGNDAFSGTALTSISIPRSVTSILHGAFANCNALSSITIPSSVTSIESNAFLGCTTLNSLYVNNVSPSNITLGIWVFSGVSTTSCTLYVPIGSKVLYAAADQWKDFAISQRVDLVALFATPNPSSGGVVVGGDSYALGTQCTVSATANKGYAFINWTDKNGTVLSTATSFVFTLTRDTAVIANFTLKKYSVTLVASPSTQGAVSGAGTFDYGSSRTVTATPNDGYGFRGWKNNKGMVLSTDKNFTFTLFQDTILTATFAKASYDFSDANGLYYKITSATTASVTYFNGNDYSGDIAVPATTSYHGTTYNVTAIGDSAFINCSGLTSVSLTDSVTSIGRYAFYKCIGLSRLTLPDAITTMGSFALANCSGLTSVTLPSGLKSISNDLFVNCTKLTSIVIPPSVTSIGNFAFYSCYALTSITILSSVTSIKDCAFGFCTGLTSLYVSNISPSNITLGSSVFWRVSTTSCTLYVPTGSKMLYAAADQWKDFVNLVEGRLTPRIDISVSQSNICSGSPATFTASSTDGGDSPAYQWKLNTKNIPGATNRIYTTTTLANKDIISCDVSSTLSFLVSNSATSNAITMTVTPNVAPMVSIASSVSKIYPGGSVTFTATPTNGGTTPSYQWYLNGDAISGATNSTYTSTTIKDNDEIYCALASSLPCATIPTATSNTITMEVSNFFTSGGICYYVTSPSYPYTAKVANDGEVSYTGNVVIPSSVSYCGTTFSVASIGNLAFCGSNDLLSVTIPSSITTIENGAFIDTNGLTSIVVDASNPNYYSNNGVLFNKQATILISCPEGKSESYTIPSGVTIIADSAFIQCDRLTSVTLPSSVTTIEDKAFMDCSNITSITFPLSIKNIKNGVFTNCTGLKDIHVKNALPSDIELGVSVFYGVSGSDCILYVPTGSKSFYLDVYPWNKFQIVEDANLFAVYVATGSAGGVATGGGTYALGSFCSLKATPSVGYGFLAWMENDTIISTNPNYSFTVSGTHTFVPSFGKICTISSSVNPSFGGVVNGVRSYVAGQLCSLTATASSSYVFTNWTEGGSEVSKDANYTFKVDGDRTLVANFVPLNNTISATSSSTSNGTVSGGATYTYGSTCALTATPRQGYVFTGWSESGSVVSTKSKYTFIVTSARTLVANFEAVKVVVTQPDGRSVTSYPSFLYGTATVTPAAGFLYSIDGKGYQSANVFNNLAIGTHTIMLKSLADSVVSPPVFAFVNASGVVTVQNYKVQATNCSCRDTKDGKIQVTLDKLYEYQVHVVGAANTSYDKSIIFTDKTFSLSNLPADTYTLTFKIDYLDNYEQTFKVVVSQPEDLSVLKVSAAPNSAQYSVSGGSNYFVVVNDQTTENNDGNVNISLQPGENRIKIYTDKLCQGVYDETIYNDVNGQLSLFPNPTKGKITIGIPGEDKNVTVDLFSLNGQLLRQYHYQIPQSKLVDMDISDFANGTYIVKVNGSVIHRSLRVVKQ